MKITYNPKDIKDNCVSCGAKLKNSKRRYIVQGNYCLNCCARAEAISKKKIDRDEDYQINLDFLFN